mmetsp:Transcript_58314/g.138797  ORF Transcript_58314/g.138797 Transcript_58314/m.138797 type:complete len:380 (-) Transcript_58314:455-1594(-)
MALRQLEAVQAELHTPVDRLQPALAASDHVHQLSVPQLDAAVAPHVPQLRDLREGLGLGALHDLIRHLVPGGVQAGLGVHQVLGHHRGLGQLTQMEDHAFPLCDQVEVSREGLGELLERMVGRRDRRVLQPVLRENLLPGLDPHLHMGDQRVVLRHSDFRLLHHKPLAARPAVLLPRHLRVVEDAVHAHHGHGVLSQGQLLEEVVRLEHDVPHAGAGQPLRLVHLLLGGLLQVLGVHRVQGEQRLPLRRLPHLQRQQQILQVDGRRGLQSGRHLHSAGGLIQHQAAQALGRRAAAHALRQALVLGDAVHAPSDVVLPAILLLLHALSLVAVLLLPLAVLDQHLGHALRVHAGLLALAALVSELAHRQRAARAQRHLLSL